MYIIYVFYFVIIATFILLEISRIYFFTFLVTNTYYFTFTKCEHELSRQQMEKIKKNYIHLYSIYIYMHKVLIMLWKFISYLFFIYTSQHIYIYKYRTNGNFKKIYNGK